MGLIVLKLNQQMVTGGQGCREFFLGVHGAEGEQASGQAQSGDHVLGSSAAERRLTTRASGCQAVRAETAVPDPSRLFGLRNRTSALCAEAAICPGMAGLAATRSLPSSRHFGRCFRNGHFQASRGRRSGWFSLAPLSSAPTGYRELSPQPSRARSGRTTTGCGPLVDFAISGVEAGAPLTRGGGWTHHGSAKRLR